MNATLGEIRIFAADFEPRGWAFCNGKELLIAQYQALYSVIGTTYGGDAKKKSFKLPNLINRAALGAMRNDGQPSTWNAGKAAGVESVAITSGQMPHHIHVASVQPGGAGTTKATLIASTQGGYLDNPGGAMLAVDLSVEMGLYAGPANTPVPMHAGSIQFTDVDGPKLIGMTLDNAGYGSTSHSNVQPSLALNYIICIDGSLPPRQL